MPGQTSLSDEKMSLPFQVGIDQAALSQGVALRRSSRFLWTALGAAVFMLIGVAAVGLHPLASHGAEESSHLVSEFAFSPMSVLGPRSILAARHPGHRHVAFPVAKHSLGWQPAGSSLSFNKGFDKVVSRRGVRGGPVMSAFVSERPVLQRVPPAPPAPPGNSGGHGDDGDGSGLYLKILSGPEIVQVFDDWVGRTKVYIMTGQFGNKELAQYHQESLKSLEEFRSFCPDKEQPRAKDTRKRFFGLYTSSSRLLEESQPSQGISDDVWQASEPRLLAVAGGSAYGGALVEVGDGVFTIDQVRKSGLAIKFIAVHPAELNDEDSEADMWITQGLMQLQADLGIRKMVIPLELEVGDDDSDDDDSGDDESDDDE